MRHSRSELRTTCRRLSLLCLAVLFALGSVTVVSGAWTDTLTVTGTISTNAWDKPADGGSSGFWRNWNAHKTYTQTEIGGFLSRIDDASTWPGPRTTDGMEEQFDDGVGPSATPEGRFLRHYLATRLNVESARLSLYSYQDIASLDRDNFLELASPSSVTVHDIIDAVEAKAEHRGSITSKQFDIMKNISEALNSA